MVQDVAMIMTHINHITMGHTEVTYLISLIDFEHEISTWQMKFDSIQS